MGRLEGEEGAAVSADDESASPPTEAAGELGAFEPTGTIPDKPPPSRSYAPESLAPFTPLRAPSLPEAAPEPGRYSLILGLLLATGLVGLVLGILAVVLSAR